MKDPRQRAAEQHNHPSAASPERPGMSFLAGSGQLATHLSGSRAGLTSADDMLRAQGKHGVDPMVHQYGSSGRVDPG